MSDGDDSDELAAPVTEYMAPGPDVTDTAPAPVIEYVPDNTYAQMPEQIVETVNAIPQEWISECIVDIPVAPAKGTDRLACSSDRIRDALACC